MQITEFTDIREELIFYHIYGLRQEWQEGESFHYISTPRPNHGLMLVQCPRMVFSFGGESLEAREGDVLYLPQGLYYSVTAYPQGSGRGDLLINFSMTDRERGEVAFFSTVTRLLSLATPKYTEDFEMVVSCHGRTRGAYLPLMEGFYRLLYKLSEHRGRREAEREEHRRIAPALRYLEEHIAEEASVSMLARLCLLSESCFRRYFRAATGESPVAYRRSLRIARAKQLLGVYEMTVGEIAEALGFYDEAYFCRCFERAVGVTPGRFRVEH